jgi:hypothetical protein
MPDAALLQPLKGCPNATYPSDHLSLAVGFRVKKYETGSVPYGAKGAESASAAEAPADAVAEEDKPVVDLPAYDPKNYDRFGYERNTSGISQSSDYSDYWKWTAKHSQSGRY